MKLLAKLEIPLDMLKIARTRSDRFRILECMQSQLQDKGPWPSRLLAVCTRHCFRDSSPGWSYWIGDCLLPTYELTASKHTAHPNRYRGHTLNKTATYKGLGLVPDKESLIVREEYEKAGHGEGICTVELYDGEF